MSRDFDKQREVNLGGGVRPGTLEAGGGRSRGCSRQFPEPLDVGDLVPDKLHTRTHEMRETKKKTRKGRREGEDGFVPLSRRGGRG